MGNQTDRLGDAGLRFFSKMTSANSHEAKNALAIINESAGLLEDLVLLEEKGQPLSADRLSRLAGKIRQQVARADELAKNSHRLAHSLDFQRGPSHLGRTVELAVSLAARFAAMARVELATVPASGELTLPVSTFQLLHIIWLALEFALDHMQAASTLDIHAENVPGGALLRLSPLTACDTTNAAQFTAAPEVRTLAEALGCTITYGPQAAELELTFRK